MAAPSPMLLERLARPSGTPRKQPLSLGLPELDEALPELGLPRSAVIELACHPGLGRATQLALMACASAQAETRATSHDGQARWCAWLDPTATLYAPGVAQTGVELARLCVVRPPVAELAKVAVRVVASHAFAVVVVDRAGVPGRSVNSPLTRSANSALTRSANSALTRSANSALTRSANSALTRWDVVVRRLALACERSDTTVLLLSSLADAQARPLPTAMRLELASPGPARLALRVARDRNGRVGSPRILGVA